MEAVCPSRKTKRSGSVAFGEPPASHHNATARSGHGGVTCSVRLRGDLAHWIGQFAVPLEDADISTMAYSGQRAYGADRACHSLARQGPGGPQPGGESDKTRSDSRQTGVRRRSMYISTKPRGEKAVVVLEGRELNWFFHNDIRTIRNTISIARPIFHGRGLPHWPANGVQSRFRRKAAGDAVRADDSQRRLSFLGAKHYRW
jgi:hypothetical protein